MRVANLPVTALIPFSTSSTTGAYIPIILRTDSDGAVKSICGSTGCQQEEFIPCAVWSYAFNRSSSSDIITIPENYLNVWDNPNASDRTALQYKYGDYQKSNSGSLVTIHGPDNNHTEASGYIARYKIYDPDNLSSISLPTIGTCANLWSCDSTLTSGSYSKWYSTTSLNNSLCIKINLTKIIAKLYELYPPSRYYTGWGVYGEFAAYAYTQRDASIVTRSDYSIGLLASYVQSSQGGGSIENKIIISNGMYSPYGKSSYQFWARNTNTEYCFVYGFQGIFPIWKGNLTSATNVNKTLYIIPTSDASNNAYGREAAFTTLTFNIYIGII